jgi:hypothetical protein
MSFDRVRIRTDQHPGGWLERSQAEKLNLSNEFGMTCTRLFTQGHYVVLSAGKNFAFDEIFLFEDTSDAGAFYASGFKDWESFPEDDDEGRGFEKVALFWAGGEMVMKECAPTMRTEVQHEQLD